jgi:hypothetical protein
MSSLENERAGLDYLEQNSTITLRPRGLPADALRQLILPFDPKYKNLLYPPACLIDRYV